MGKKLSSEQKNKIRKEVLSGKTKYSVAKEMGISYQLVYYYTQDIPSSKPNVFVATVLLTLVKETFKIG